MQASAQISFHSLAVRLLSVGLSPRVPASVKYTSHHVELPCFTSEPSCHSNTVITLSSFTANEKVKYERLATAVICDLSSLPAGVKGVGN